MTVFKYRECRGLGVIFRFTAHGRFSNTGLWERLGYQITRARDATFDSCKRNN